MNANQRRSLIKKLPFYCPGIDCHFTKSGSNRNGKPKYKCENESCTRAFMPLKTPINFSTWTGIDKALDKEIHTYHRWKYNFDRLKAFYEEYGHTWPKKEPKGQSRAFSNWASFQRMIIRKGKMHPLKLKLLKSINFKLDYHSKTDEVTMTVRNARFAIRNPFPEQLKIVLAWKEKNERWPNPRNAGKEERILADITRRWRINGRLYEEEIDLLDKLEFVWNIYDDQFKQKVKRFKEFKIKFGSFYLVDDKEINDYDRHTAYLISLMRWKMNNDPPKKEWKLKEIKALNLGTFNDRI